MTDATWTAEDDLTVLRDQPVQVSQNGQGVGHEPARASDRYLEELDLLIERQIRAANDPDQGTPGYEVQPEWPVVAGQEPPPELDPTCRGCDGDGSDPEDGSTCPMCGGTGQERRT